MKKNKITVLKMEQVPIDEKELNKYSSAQVEQSPMLPAVPIDGDGQRLHEGDRVFTYDVFTPNQQRVYGTLRKNSEYPDVSEWYVEYDDGEDCAVIEFSLLWKA